jgi:transmembrane carrier protein
MEAAILQAYATDLDAARAQDERAAIAKSLGLAPEGSPEATTTTTPTAAATLAPFTTTNSSTTAPASATIATTTMSRPRPPSPSSDAAASSKTDVGPERPKKNKSKLTTYVPDPGYFLAGAVAGGVSRTATAPLDRLKVYLLVKTQMSTDTALKALKQGRPLLALRNAVKPIGDGVQDLWRAGGMRSMFAGKLNCNCPTRCTASEELTTWQAMDST